MWILDRALVWFVSNVLALSLSNLSSLSLNYKPHQSRDLSYSVLYPKNLEGFQVQRRPSGKICGMDEWIHAILGSAHPIYTQFIHSVAFLTKTWNSMSKLTKCHCKRAIPVNEASGSGGSHHRPKAGCYSVPSFQYHIVKEHFKK